jgi:CelD/BcsL family acetyltransferase involved in cellulose biosynthesis
MDDDQPAEETPEGGERRHRRRPGVPMITSESFADLENEWAALHARIPEATPFIHPAWHSTWLRHFGGGSLPVYLSIRFDDALAGVAALDMERDVARSLGDHNVRDYGGPLALPGYEDRVAAGVLEWLAEDLTPALVLWGVPAGSVIADAFTRAAAAAGWDCLQQFEANCPTATLPGTFDEYLAGLGKHDRHEIRRKLRNLAAAGQVTFESVTAVQEVTNGMDRLLAMMRASHDDKGEFLTPPMEAFFRDLAAAFSPLGMLRLSTLSLDGIPGAMTLAFENATTTFLYNSGYDPAYSHVAVGLLSKVYAIRDAIDRGHTTFDFLRGDEPYKRNLGGLPSEVVTLTLRRR